MRITNCSYSIKYISGTVFVVELVSMNGLTFNHVMFLILMKNKEVSLRNAASLLKIANFKTDKY